MRSLTLLRHAKTEPDSDSGRDVDRSLTEQGRADANGMGRAIRDLGLHYDLVLASSARRVAETVQALGDLHPQWDERIYNASTGELLVIVQEASDEVRRLMLVGHNPGFEELASMLIGSPLGLSTCTLIEIELAIDHWRDAGNYRGRMVRFLNPKELA